MGLVVFFVQSGQPGGKSFDRGFEVRIEVDKFAQSFGEPRQGDFLITPPGLEFFDSAISEIHGLSNQENACCMSVMSSSTWRAWEPTDGADDSGRDTRNSGKPSNSPLKCRAICGHGPWLAGSS